MRGVHHLGRMKSIRRALSMAIRQLFGEQICLSHRAFLALRGSLARGLVMASRGAKITLSSSPQCAFANFVWIGNSHTFGLRKFCEKSKGIDLKEEAPKGDREVRFADLRANRCSKRRLSAALLVPLERYDLVVSDHAIIFHRKAPHFPRLQFKSKII
jgi:hypothetical protein